MAIILSSYSRDSLGTSHPERRQYLSGTDISLGDGDGAGGLDTINASAGLDIFPAHSWIVIDTPIGDPNKGVRVKVLTSSATKLEVAAGSFTAFSAGPVVDITWYKNKGSWRQTFENFIMRGFAENRPSSADAAEPGSPVVEFTLNGGAFTPGSPLNGLNFGIRDGEYIRRAIDPETAASEVWRAVPTQTATIRSICAYSNDVVTGASVNSSRFWCTVTGPNQGGDVILTNGPTVTLDIPVDIVSVKIIIKGADFS